MLGGSGRWTTPCRGSDRRRRRRPPLLGAKRCRRSVQRRSCAESSGALGPSQRPMQRGEPNDSCGDRTRRRRARRAAWRYPSPRRSSLLAVGASRRVGAARGRGRGLTGHPRSGRPKATKVRAVARRRARLMRLALHETKRSSRPGFGGGAPRRRRPGHDEHVEARPAESGAPQRPTTGDGEPRSCRVRVASNLLHQRVARR